MKKNLFLLSCQLILGVLPISAQTPEPEVIVMQVYYTGISKGNISIIYGAGKTIVSEFPGQNTTQMGETIQIAIKKLYQEGYALKSTFSTGTVNNATLIFIKEK